MKKLIFCDIDGTILDGSRGMNEASEKTKYAISELKKDNYVFIASGRCRGLLTKEIFDLDPSGYILCNGAYAQIDGKSIYAEYFSDEAVRKILEVTKKYEGFSILETLDSMYVDSLESRPFKLFMEHWGKALDGFIEEKDYSDKYLIAMIGFMEKKTLRKANEELREYVDIFDHKHFSSCDVNVKGVTKATGVKRVMEYLGVAFEDTYCFGDGINDLEMLEAVRHPVIMANSMPELKGRGFEETDDVLDDGFYNYLLAHKLIKAL